jgi:amidase
MTIIDWDAHRLSDEIHSRRVSCREVMAAYLARIHQLNPRFNAIVNLADDDALLRQADVCDVELARGHSRGWMHGMPQAIKDVAHAAGFPTTFGSPLLRDTMASEDGLMAERMRAAGCIVVGKTNTPEFGLGSHTFNEVFGATRNAWDPAVSAGGSSGGAAVALALRLLPVADGSDFMGSLRNPAAWNHVFGLRPSQGRVPLWPSVDVWMGQLGTEGPMARCVRDLALLLQTQAGWDARTPLAQSRPLERFDVPADPQAAAQTLRGLRVGWMADLDGHLAMEAGLLQVCEQALHRMQGAGAIVEPIRPPFDPAEVWQAWLVWRRALTAPRVSGLLTRPGAREQIKPEALWEYEQAQGTPLTALIEASAVRTRYLQYMLGLYERFDVLALPSTQVWPFPIEQRWPTHIGDREMDTYHRWMEVTLYATFAGLPAISVPAGFHANGRWPAGLQLVGRPRGDAELLRVAAAYEAVSAELLASRSPWVE